MVIKNRNVCFCAGTGVVNLFSIFKDLLVLFPSCAHEQGLRLRAIGQEEQSVHSM